MDAYNIYKIKVVLGFQFWGESESELFSYSDSPWIKVVDFLNKVEFKEENRTMV